MNSPTYKNLRRLLEKWPIDSTKAGRDFGEHLRILVKSSFGGITRKSTGELEHWEEIHAGLERIASDRYKTAFSVRNPTSSTGLTGQQCQQAMSNAIMEVMHNEDKGFIKRIFSFKSKQ